MSNSRKRLFQTTSNKSREELHRYKQLKEAYIEHRVDESFVPLLLPLTTMYHKILDSLISNYKLKDEKGFHTEVTITGGLEKNRIYPRINDLLEPFRYNVLDRVKLVILFDEPVRASTSTGYPLIRDNSFFDPDTILDTSGSEDDNIKIIRLCLQQFYLNRGVKMKESQINIDPLKWADQGIMLMYSSFTSLQSAENAHLNIWEPFTKEILKGLYENNPDTLFVSFGAFSIDCVNAVSGAKKQSYARPCMFPLAARNTFILKNPFQYMHDYLSTIPSIENTITWI